MCLSMLEVVSLLIQNSNYYAWFGDDDFFRVGKNEATQKPELLQYNITYETVENHEIFDDGVYTTKEEVAVGGEWVVCVSESDFFDLSHCDIKIYDEKKQSIDLLVKE